MIIALCVIAYLLVGVIFAAIFDNVIRNDEPWVTALHLMFWPGVAVIFFIFGSIFGSIAFLVTLSRHLSRSMNVR